MASSHCEKRDRLEPHVCCTAGSLGYWHALHRAIHIRIRCCSERLRSLLCSLMLDYETRRTPVSSYRKALIFECACQHVMYGSRYLEHEFLKVSVSLVAAQPHLSGQSDTEQGFLQNVAKSRKRGRKKKKGRIVCLCTHCIPGYLYRVKKLCRLHVSTWWELLNYWWMFLITSHKCWNTTLLQCLEEEEGGSIMSHMFREALACT